MRNAAVRIPANKAAVSATRNIDSIPKYNVIVPAIIGPKPQPKEDIPLMTPIASPRKSSDVTSATYAELLAESAEKADPFILIAKNTNRGSGGR